MSRPSWDQYFMSVARVVASRGTCDRKRVGVVVVRDHNILSTGYNGAVAGLPHCDDVGHLIENDHCVAGPTVISKFQVGPYNTGHRTAAQIYKNWLDPQKRSAMLRMNIRCVEEDGSIVPGHILDVWSTGCADVVRVRTRLGRSVVTTCDQRYLTLKGWVEIQELHIGDKIALNGQAAEDDVKWLRRKYEQEGLTIKKIAELTGRQRATIAKRLDIFGIKRREFSFGGWNRGLRREAAHSYKGLLVSKNVARSRAKRYASSAYCTICGGDSWRMEVHHIDGNVWNDADDNLLALCKECHTLAHTPHAKLDTIKYDDIVSIDSCGKQETYDFTTTHGNFVGDGFILHNCVRVSHSESNAICQAAKNGICLNGATMYTTLSPCWPCFKLIVNAGIKKIVYAEFYRDTKIFEASQQLGIELVQLEESKAASEQDSLQSLQVKLDDRKKVIDCLMAQLKDR